MNVPEMCANRPRERRNHRPGAQAAFFILAYGAFLAVAAHGTSVRAYDLNEWLSVGGAAAAAGQCQILTQSGGASDACRGALPVQPELSIRPTKQDEVYVKLGFAAGNGLNTVSNFSLASWAADLNDDVEDINGRWDYLLNAWYKHTFMLPPGTVVPPGTTLGFTGGIIDATDYLDDNAYANDEYTQFMNEAFVNGFNSFLPSYDVGAALELDMKPWSVRVAYMNIGENDDGNNTNFLGGQVGYTLKSSLGEGTYRALVAGASKDFLNAEGTAKEGHLAFGLSFDQQIGETFGAFLRMGWQDQDAAVSYEAIYSGGLNILGTPWRRPKDNIGMAYGFLDGGNLDVRWSHVAEIYYRFEFNENFALTADTQYMKDILRGADGADGFVFGLRGTIKL